MSTSSISVPFPCKRCLEQMVLIGMWNYVEGHDVTTAKRALQACTVVGKDIEKGLRTKLSCFKIRQIVKGARVRYIAFCDFCHIPGVRFDCEENKVHVSVVYLKGHKVKESSQDIAFREEGFADWDMLHFLFRKMRMANFPDEPITSYVDPAVYTDSDEENYK